MARNRGGWKGTATFEFYVERDEDEVVLNVEAQGYYTPGYTSGLPENCYPDEGELEILSVIGPDGSDWSVKLTKVENDSLKDAAAEKCQESTGDEEPPGYYDRDDDYDPPSFRGTGRYDRDLYD